MKRLYPLAVCLLSFSLLSCGDDNDPVSDIEEPPTIEDNYTAQRRQLCEAFGVNPEELDDDAFGACWNDQFLVLSALRKTDGRLLVAAFDSVKNKQVIHDYSIAAPKTVTKPYYDEQVEYRLRSITPQIIRINDGFICVVGTRYFSEQQHFFDTTYAYFNNGTKTICRKMEDVAANCSIRPWYENSCLLISDYGKTLCVTTEGEIKIDLDAHILRDHQYPLDYDKYIELSLEAKDGKTGMTITRKHIAADGAITVWSSHVHLSGRITTSARMSCTATMNEYGGFIIDATIIEKDGTQCDCDINLNAETGEVLSSTIIISSVIHP